MQTKFKAKLVQEFHCEIETTFSLQNLRKTLSLQTGTQLRCEIGKNISVNKRTILLEQNSSLSGL